MHRIATSGRYRSGLIEIQTEWSLDDLFDAVLVLDMYNKLDDMADRDP